MATKKCPYCGKEIDVAEESQSPAEVHAEKQVVRSSWWSRNKGWVIGLIILQVVLIVITVIAEVWLADSYTHYF